MPHLSEQDLLAELRALAGRIQRIPRKKDMDEIGRYSTQTYLDRFESWQSVLQTAGLADRREPHLSRDKLRSYLREFGEPHGRTPTRAELRERGEFSPWVFSDRFSSWLAALDAAGFDITPRTTPAAATVSYRDLRTTLEKLATELGRPPSRADVDTHNDYASDLYCAAFGSWEDALRFARLPIETVRGGPTYTTETLLEHLRELSEQLERPPSVTDLQDHGEYALGTYQHRFGSWTNALRSAGLTPRDPAEQLPAKTILLKEVQDLSAESGHPPSPAAMRQEGEYLPETYLVQFESWDQVLRLADYEPKHAWSTESSSETTAFNHSGGT